MRLGRIAASTLTLVLLLASPGWAQSGEQARTYGEAVAVEGGQYWNIQPIELRAMLEADGSVPVINVHIPFAGNIPDTDDSIPFDEITDNLDRLPADKDASIVLYCRSGPMSERAATELVGLGYTNVYNLDGGLRAWSAAGFPMEGR